MKRLLVTLLMVYVSFAMAMHPYGAENLRKQIQHEKNSQLLDAAQEGNIAQVRRMLEEGAEVNASGDNNAYRDNKNWTPLLLAASNEHAQVCKLLIAHGADMNMQNSGDVSPLMIAALRGYEGICRILIRAGADINVREVNSHDAFYGAGAYPEIRRMLCDRQEQLKNSIVITVHCLRQLKKGRNQLGQVLYPNADVLLKPHLVLEKNYKPRRLAQMKEICRRDDRIERRRTVILCVLVGMVVVMLYVAGSWLRQALHSQRTLKMRPAFYDDFEFGDDFDW